MSEFIYRFRPVKRLLSDDGVSGELDSQYIFFASPEKLNDPLEGYKDLYFRGDRIIWRNLIKHYLRCLIDSCLDYLCSEKGALPNKNIGVFANALSAPEPLNELNTAIFERIISEPSIEDFISKLATDRKVRRWELFGYIQTLHIHFLDVIFEVLHERELCPERLDYLSKSRDQRLAQIKQNIPTIIADSNLTKEQEDIFKKRYQTNSELQLLTRYRAYDSKGREAWFFITFEYPETFCRSIEKLMYPEWYTACFMSACTDSSIWGSYGGYHQDVCLKFRTKTIDTRITIELTAPTGQDRNGMTWGPVNFTFHEVSYEKSFVDIDFFRSIGRLPIPNLSATWFRGENNERSICADDMFTNEESWRKNYWNNFYHAATVKLRAWDREKESRLILTSMLNNIESDETRKLHYDFNLLEGVIFGINTPLESKFKIIRKVEDLCEKFGRSQFSFYQARYDENTREIMHDKLESIRVGHMKPNIP